MITIQIEILMYFYLFFYNIVIIIVIVLYFAMYYKYIYIVHGTTFYMLRKKRVGMFFVLCNDIYLFVCIRYTAL